MTLINHDKLLSGVMITILLVLAVALILYYIFSGQKRDVWSKKKKSVLPLVFALALIVLAIVLVFKALVLGNSLSF